MSRDSSSGNELIVGSFEVLAVHPVFFVRGAMLWITVLINFSNQFGVA